MRTPRRLAKSLRAVGMVQVQNLIKLHLNNQEINEFGMPNITLQNIRQYLK